MDHSIFVGALSSIRMRAFGVHVHVCVCEREAFFALVHISRFCHGYLATWAFLDVSLNLNRFRGWERERIWERESAIFLPPLSLK